MKNDNLFDNIGNNSFGNMQSNSGGLGTGLPQVNDISKNYEDKSNYSKQQQKKDELLLPFMVPFYFLSEKAAMYYLVYKHYTSSLEKMFKERVFTNNSPITGVTEAKVDKHEFYAVKRYQRGALIVFILTTILTICSIISTGLISVISTLILMYVFISSFFVDLYYPAKHYTYDSKKFADERLEITYDFYTNYIKNFHLTESVYISSIFVSWIIVFVTTFFKDLIEYTIIFDTGILTHNSWYFFVVLLVIPTSMLIFYYFEKQKIMNSADIKREEIITEIQNTASTSFDIARQKLKDYK